MSAADWIVVQPQVERSWAAASLGIDVAREEERPICECEKDVQALSDARVGSVHGGGVGLALSPGSGAQIALSKENLVVGRRALRATFCLSGWIGLLRYYTVSRSSIRINPHETTSPRERPRDVVTGAAEGPPFADSRGRARRGGVSHRQTNYARSKVGEEDRSRNGELDSTLSGTSVSAPLSLIAVRCSQFYVAYLTTQQIGKRGNGIKYILSLKQPVRRPHSPVKLQLF